MTQLTYADSGVDIDAGNEAVDRIKQHVRKTYSSAVLSDLGHFAGVYDLKTLIQDYDHPVLVQSVDGVGTKTIMARQMGMFEGLGQDLLSACCNDIVAMGARPISFLDYIANDKLNPQVVETLVASMASACAKEGIALLGGETAEMPDTYLPGEHDLVGMITGVAEKDGLITGESIQAGDIIYGLPSSGCHTNGFSLVRKVFPDPNIELAPFEGPIGKHLLAPHINYTQPVMQALSEGLPIKGMAHITGGGLDENIQRILPEGRMVEIDRTAWHTPPIFECIQQHGNIETEEMFRTFNMGIGFVSIGAALPGASAIGQVK